MDTRTTRLRSAARTAVAKALSDEKENPRGVATRSRTKSECDHSLFLFSFSIFNLCHKSSLRPSTSVSFELEDGGRW